MEYTFPTPAIRNAVREVRGASFSDADDSTPEFGVRFELDRAGGRVPTSNPVLEQARADGYVLVGGEYTPSHEYPEDIDLEGVQTGDLDLAFEPGDALPDTDDTLTMGDIHAKLEPLVDHTKEDETNGYTQYRIDVDEDADAIDISEQLQLLGNSSVHVADVTASEEGNFGPPSAYIRVQFDRPDPFEMPGITEREQMTIYRHEALVLVQALDQYKTDRNTGRLKSKFVKEHNLERYIQYLD